MRLFFKAVKAVPAIFAFKGAKPYTSLHVELGTTEQHGAKIACILRFFAKPRVRHYKLAEQV